MSLFVDTSAWSATLRRDQPKDAPQVHALIRALETGEQIVSTGLVLQELLQGFAGPKAREQIIDRFTALPLIVPDRNDHVEAAGLRNRCRQRGVQVGTIDALFAHLCIRHELTLLTLDEDFGHIANHCPLRLWKEHA